MNDRSNIRNRRRYVADDWDPSIPYGGKVYLARKRKPESWFIISCELIVLAVVIVLGYYSYYHIDYLYTHTVKFYAHLGFQEAQHQLGQRYLRGKGVPLHHPNAMHWFQKAADQGHPHAAYNLAIAKLKGFHDLEKGETRKFLHHASKHGIDEAHRLLKEVCEKGKCHD